MIHIEGVCAEQLQCTEMTELLYAMAELEWANAWIFLDMQVYKKNISVWDRFHRYALMEEDASPIYPIKPSSRKFCSKVPGCGRE